MKILIFQMGSRGFILLVMYYVRLEIHSEAFENVLYTQIKLADPEIKTIKMFRGDFHVFHSLRAY